MLDQILSLCVITSHHLIQMKVDIVIINNEEKNVYGLLYSTFSMNERTMFSISCTILSGCPSIIRRYNCKLVTQTTATGIKETISQHSETYQQLL